MQKKSKLLIILAVALLVCGAAFYFLYFVRTPSYALNAARTAFQQHDREKFEQYVDVDSVMSNAFEDIINAESKINNDNLLDNPFAIGILHMLKPAVVDLMKEDALDRIATKPGAEQKQADPVPDAMMRNMERHVPYKELVLKDVKLNKQNKDKATATIVLHNKALEKDFVAELGMEVNDKGTWQIKKISNLEKLIIEVTAARKAQQAAANKPIMERLSKAVQTMETHLAMFKNNDADLEPQNKLTAIVSVKNNTGVAINRMYYDVMLFDEQDKQLYSYPEHFRGEIRPGQVAELCTDKPLNSMLPDDKKLMELDISKVKCRIQVTYIAFDDGNVLSPNAFMQ